MLPICERNITKLPMNCMRKSSIYSVIKSENDFNTQIDKLCFFTSNNSLTDFKFLSSWKPKRASLSICKRGWRHAPPQFPGPTVVHVFHLFQIHVHLIHTKIYTGLPDGKKLILRVGGCEQAR